MGVHIMNQIIWTKKPWDFEKFHHVAPCFLLQWNRCFLDGRWLSIECKTEERICSSAFNEFRLQLEICKSSMEFCTQWFQWEKKKINKKSICKKIDRTLSVQSFNMMEAKVFELFCIKPAEDRKVTLCVSLWFFVGIYFFGWHHQPNHSDDNQKAGAISITISIWLYIENKFKSSLSNAPSVFRQMHYYVVQLSSDWSDGKIIVIS